MPCLLTRFLKTIHLEFLFLFFKWIYVKAWFSSLVHPFSLLYIAPRCFRSRNDWWANYIVRVKDERPKKGLIKLKCCSKTKQKKSRSVLPVSRWSSRDSLNSKLLSDKRILKVLSFNNYLPHLYRPHCVTVHLPQLPCSMQFLRSWILLPTGH